MDLYNLWLHHRCYVYFPSCALSTTPRPPCLLFFCCCEVEMRWEFLSSLHSFHKVRQGASGREIICHWFTRASQNAEVSLSYVQKWLWVSWCGLLFTQFAKSLKQEFNVYRTLEVLTFGHNLPFFLALVPLCCHLWVTDSVVFISPFQKISLGSKGFLTRWPALFSRFS